MVVVYVSEEKHGTVERKFTVPCFFVVQDEAGCITKRKYIYVCNESLKIRKTKGGSYAKEQKRRNDLHNNDGHSNGLCNDML